MKHSERNVAMKLIFVMLILLLGCQYKPFLEAPEVRSNYQVSSHYPDTDNYMNSVIDDPVLATVSRPAQQWYANRLRLHFQNGISAISRVTDRIAILSSGGSLFRTTDSGKTWRRFGKGQFFDSNIPLIAFCDSKNGWLVAQSLGNRNSYSANDSFRVFGTNDGGENWQVFYDQIPGVFLSSFVSDRDIWISGLSYLGDSPLRFSAVLLRVGTSGEIRSETDFLTQICDPSGIVSSDCEIHGISLDKFGDPVIISNRRIVFGKTASNRWQEFDKLNNSVPQLGVKKFDFDTSEPWILESTRSLEGTLTRLTLVDQSYNSFRHQVRLLRDYYIEDAIRLSESEFVFSGSAPKQYRQEESEQFSAVLLYSNDGGITWDEVYRNADSSCFQRILLLRDGELWAATDSGRIVRIKSSKLHK